MDYKNAGVDIEAGYKSVELMKKHVQATMRPEVLGGIGGFSGAFSMSAFKNMEKPTLVSGTAGVGTKLNRAFLMATPAPVENRYDCQRRGGGLQTGGCRSDRRGNGRDAGILSGG